MSHSSSQSPFRRELHDSIALTVPIAASQLAQAATGFVDTVMMGWMGQETLAAGGLAAALFMTLFVSGLGMITGVTSLVAEAQGAGNRDRMQSYHPIDALEPRGISGDPDPRVALPSPRR